MLNGKKVFSIYFAFPKKTCNPLLVRYFFAEKKNRRKKLMDCGDARGGKKEDAWERVGTVGPEEERGLEEREEGRGLSLNLGREGKGRPDDIFKDVCSIGFVEEEGRGDIVFFFSPGGRPGRQIYRSKISKSNLTQASKSFPGLSPAAICRGGGSVER